ncbi:MAG: M28 family peptidase [Clostridiales bacterium]|nr:M28 family peptidase [Clostridiales bacterium]
MNRKRKMNLRMIEANSNDHAGRGRLIAVLLIIMMVFTASCSGRGKAEGQNAASAEIADLISDVSADNAADFDFTEKAMEYLEYIGTELPDRMLEGGKDHDAAREWIVSELKKAGYSDDQISLQDFSGEWLGGLTGTNIILTIEGEDPSKQIIVGGHYDGDGVGDNGSGTALLLANAVGLQGVKPHYTVKIIFFDAEEEGCFGSEYNVEQMSDEEVDSTLYMVNIDSLAFGDYCNIYGGTYSEMDMYSDEPQTEAPPATEAYTFAADMAERLGFKVLRTEDLDGYYAAHGTGPEIEAGTLYTNPWTPQNPAPANSCAMSPATLPASDHIFYMDRGIEYIYFEATNWFASAEDDEYGLSYTGYLETYDTTLGDQGMFMNTEFDTWENLNGIFPGRAEAHFRLYSPLLSALILVR